MYIYTHIYVYIYTYVYECVYVFFFRFFSIIISYCKILNMLLGAMQQVFLVYVFYI